MKRNECASGLSGFFRLLFSPQRPLLSLRVFAHDYCYYFRNGSDPRFPSELRLQLEVASRMTHCEAGRGIISRNPLFGLSPRVCASRSSSRNRNAPHSLTRVLGRVIGFSGVRNPGPREYHNIIIPSFLHSRKASA
jgi:hypothetical protein